MAGVDAAGHAPAAWRRIRLPVTGWIGVCVTTFWIVIAIVGPWIAPYDQGAFVSDSAFDPIGPKLLLGSDYLGRDILSRLLFGARTTIGLAFLGTAIAILVGGSLGLFAAVVGGWIDTALSRVVDAFLSIPSLIIGLVIVAAVGSSIPALLVGVALAYAPGHFRIARALGMDLNVMDFVEVARARGESTWWIVANEILPNAVTPLLTDFGLRFIFIVLFLSGMSFLGLGVQPPDADWGSMVRENLLGLWDGAPAALVAASAIASLSIGINLIVDSLSARAGRGSERGAP